MPSHLVSPVTCRALGSQLFHSVCSGQMSVLTQQLRDLLIVMHLPCCISLRSSRLGDPVNAVCMLQLLLFI